MRRFRRPEWWPRPRHRRSYGLKYCPDAGEDVLVSRCVRCDRFKDWAENGLECCWWEYRERLELGLATKNYQEHIEAMREIDPDAYREMVQEQEAINRRADGFLASLREETEEVGEYEKDDSDEDDDEDEVDESDEDEEDNDVYEDEEDNW